MKQLKIQDLIQNSRGKLVQVTSGGNWRQLNVIERKQGVLGAGHYHRHTCELFYVLEGSLILKIIPILEGGLLSYSFQKGDCFEVAPSEQHYMQFIDDTTLVVLYSEVFNADSPDIFVDEKLPDLKELFND